MALIDLISLLALLLNTTAPSTFDPLSLPLCVPNQLGPWGNFCAQAARTALGDLRGASFSLHKYTLSACTSTLNYNVSSTLQ